MNRSVVGKMVAWKSVSVGFELWHCFVQFVDSAFADDMHDVFLKKGNVFTKV